MRDKETWCPLFLCRHRLVVLLAVAALGACSKSTSSASKHTPTKSYDLPAAQAELQALLPQSSPEVAIAIKGRLRSLQGKGSLDLTRPVVVGASLSSGLGSTPLGEAIGGGIAGPHAMNALASTMFFQSPYANGRDQIDQALAAEPSVVFALDLLFWYAYRESDLEGRMAGLDTGLRNLERIEVPLILGDLPDMRRGEPWMLPPSSVPPPEQLAQLNARIHQWARPRLNVQIVALAEWSMALATDGEVIVSPGEKPVPAKSLMNPDGLHPNIEGVRFMLLRLDPSLEIGFPDTPPSALVFH